MPYCHQIDTSEGIDVNKARASKDKGIKDKGFGLHKGFKFQSTVCNRYQFKYPLC